MLENANILPTSFKLPPETKRQLQGIADRLNAAPGRVGPPCQRVHALVYAVDRVARELLGDDAPAADSRPKARGKRRVNQS